MLFFHHPLCLILDQFRNGVSTFEILPGTSLASKWRESKSCFCIPICNIIVTGKISCYGGNEGEGEVAVFSAKRLDRRDRADLIESVIPCHDAQVVGSYRGSNQLHLTVLTSRSKDYTTAPQHLQSQVSECF